MKKLEFECHSALQFLPYKDFYWQTRSTTVLKKWYEDISGSVIYTNFQNSQSVPALGSRLMYNSHLLGLNTSYAVRTNPTRSYPNAYSASNAPTVSGNFVSSDYVPVNALWDSSKLPNFVYEFDTIYATNTTASYTEIKTKGYSPASSLAMQNYFCEIENFYGVKRSIIKSTKKPDPVTGKFKISERVLGSNNKIRNVVMWVAIDNDYMPTTNFDFIGAWPWYPQLPYGGLGKHTVDVFNQGSTDFKGFEVTSSNPMLRSKLNVPDRRLLKIEYQPASDALEELSFEENLASASYSMHNKGVGTYGADTGAEFTNVTPMDMRHNLIFGSTKDGNPFVSTNGENVTALLDAASSSYTITALSGTYSSDVPSVATVSSYVPKYESNKGIYLRILTEDDPLGNPNITDRVSFNDGNISAAKLFGFEGKQKIGDIVETKPLEESVVVIPYINDKDCKAEPIMLDEARVLNRLFFLEKTNQLRFRYFTDTQLDSITLNRENSTFEGADFIDDIILAMEKYVFPPELDWLMSIRESARAGELTIASGQISLNRKSIAPYFAAVFQFSLNLNRDQRLGLWQGNLTGSLTTSVPQIQTISVPIEQVLGSDFKFEGKTIRAQTFKAKYRAETNYDVYTKKKTGQEYNKNLDYDWSYNWPYDQCTILPLNQISAKVYCREDE